MTVTHKVYRECQKAVAFIKCDNESFRITPIEHWHKELKAGLEKEVEEKGRVMVKFTESDPLINYTDWDIPDRTAKDEVIFWEIYAWAYTLPIDHDLFKIA